MKIVWTDQAYRRLAGIEDFVARDRPEAAERLGLRRVLSIDADFDVYRDARGRPLTNLLRD